MNKWLGISLAVATASGSLLVWVMGISAEAADTKRRVDTVEKRQVEDRQVTRESLSEVKEHAKIIDSNVQIILQKVTAMEAVQRSERRERGR
jgi:hypothetical protein